LTWLIVGLAVHPVQDAVSVAMRLVWSEDAAIMVTVAPAAVVTTEALLSMTPFDAARSIAAPITTAFPLVNPLIVKVTDEVPSAFKTLALELIMIVATLAFAVAAGVMVVLVEGVLALPPPPPQATSATVHANPNIDFNKFILTFL
jgi:hypothetical protein